jgi:hypothetical protein
MYDVECQHKTGEDKNSLIIQGSNVKVDAKRLNGHAARCFKNCKNLASNYIFLKVLSDFKFNYRQ